jgi:uncharacterized membrane protein YfcA
VSWSDAAAILGGLVAGFLSGTIGIGGGLAFVPILTIGFRSSQIVAQGTSLAAIVPTAIVGGITHLRLGNVDRPAGLWTGVGGTVGALIGALVAVHLESTLLQRAFGLFVIISAGIMFRRAVEHPVENKQVPPPA